MEDAYIIAWDGFLVLIFWAGMIYQEYLTSKNK